jgi:NitT/TauT family transport system substrate-binding protein
MNVLMQFWVAFFVLIFVLSSSVSFAMDRMRIGYSSLSDDQSPLWSAQAAGTYKKYGLDVELILFGGGTLAIQAVISGDVSLAGLAGPAVINAGIRGADIVVVLNGTNGMTSWIVSKPNIRTAEQLRGKKIAISRFGSSSDFAVRYAVSRLGLNPDKDVVGLQIGTNPARLAALEQGVVDAAVVTPPINFMSVIKGYYKIADLSEMGLAYPMQVLVTTKSYLSSKRDMVKRVAKAQIEAVARFKNDSLFGTQVLKKYFPHLTDDIIRRTYEMSRGDQVQPRDPSPSIAAIQTVLGEAAMRDPGVKKYNPEQFIDMSITNELKTEGFISQVYSVYKK